MEDVVSQVNQGIRVLSYSSKELLDNPKEERSMIKFAF